MRGRIHCGTEPGVWSQVDRQRRASSPHSPSAPVGQAGIQAEQVPQSRSMGLLAGTEASVTTVPSSIHGPCPGVNTMVLLPSQPDTGANGGRPVDEPVVVTQHLGPVPPGSEEFGDRPGDPSHAIVLVGSSESTHDRPLL